MLEIAQNGPKFRPRKRDKKLKEIIQDVRAKPRTVGELTGPRSTNYGYLDYLQYLGVVRKISGGRWSWIDYVELQEKIEDYKKIYNNLPSLEEMARVKGVDPLDKDFRKEFFQAISRVEGPKPAIFGTFTASKT